MKMPKYEPLSSVPRPTHTIEQLLSCKYDEIELVLSGYYKVVLWTMEEERENSKFISLRREIRSLDFIIQEIYIDEHIHRAYVPILKFIFSIPSNFIDFYLSLTEEELLSCCNNLPKQNHASEVAKLKMIGSKKKSFEELGLSNQLKEFLNYLPHIIWQKTEPLAGKLSECNSQGRNRSELMVTAVLLKAMRVLINWSLGLNHQGEIGSKALKALADI